MSMFLYDHRQPQGLSAERRLCRQAPLPGAPSGSPQPRTLERAVDFASQWTQWAGRGVLNQFGAIKDGLQDAWTRDTSNEQLKARELTGAGEFLNRAPPKAIALINNAFENDRGRLTLSDIANVLNISRWIQMFKDPDIFDMDKHPLQAPTFLPPAGADRADPDYHLHAVKGIFFGEDELGRKILYHDFVTSIIPGGAQSEFPDTFGEVTMGSGAASDVMIENQTTIATAMEAMIGGRVLEYGDPAYNIAQRGLMHRFFQDGRPYDPSTGGGSKISYQEKEFQDFLRFNPGVTHVEQIRASTTPSFLRGAVNMGVLQQGQIEFLLEVSQARMESSAHRIAESQSRLDDLMRLSKRSLQREAKNFGDVFHSLSGIEKLALVAAGVFALTTKTGRRIGMGAAILWFGSKFLLKSDKPFGGMADVASQLAIKSHKFASNQILGRLGLDTAVSDMTPEDLSRRSRLVESFFSENLRRDLDSSVEAFTTLFDMDLPTLMKYLTINDLEHFFQDQKGRLNVEDPQFQREARAALVRRGGLSQADAGNVVRNLFNGPMKDAIALEAGDALASVAYLAAVDANDPRVQDIRHFMNDRAIGSLDDLPEDEVDLGGGRRIHPRRLLYQCILEGRSNPPTQTLGTFIEKQLQIQSGPSQRDLERIDYDRFRMHKDAIEGYEYPAGSGSKVGFEVKQINDYVVSMRIAGGGYPTEIRMNIRAFADASSPRAIIDRWIREVFEKKKREMEATIAYGTAPWQLALLGEDIGMYAGQINAAGVEIGKAKSSAYKFLSMPVDDIRLKYVTWFEAHWMVVPPVVPTSYDPL
jgi:hypothetical protein